MQAGRGEGSDMIPDGVAVGVEGSFLEQGLPPARVWGFQEPCEGALQGFPWLENSLKMVKIIQFWFCNCNLEVGHDHIFHYVQAVGIPAEPKPQQQVRLARGLCRASHSLKRLKNS